MEKYEKIEYDYIDSIGQWRTATVYELIEWNETETETETQTNKD
jgi:hypothetical protein